MDVFVSYSSKDLAWKEQVSGHLDQMRMAGVLRYATWDDSNIHVGEKWDVAIKAAIDNAKVALLLISSDFLTSDYIMNVEVPAFLDKAESDSLVIYPVLLRPCAWKAFPWLNELEHFHKGKPLSGMEMHTREVALTDLVSELGRLVADEGAVEAPEEEEAAAPLSDPPVGLSSVGEGPRSGADPAPDVRQSAVPAWPSEGGSQSEPSGLSSAIGARLDALAASGPKVDDKGFLTEAGVSEMVLRRTGKTPRKLLRVLRTKSQRTWFVAVPGVIVCLLDDERTRASTRLIQWQEPVDALTKVSAMRKAGHDWLGLAGVGRRQRWLANLRDFDNDPKQLEAALRDLKEAAQG